MALHVHRSNRVEQLVAALAAVLGATLPDDPFSQVPIAVGSRGMERWLRHELATVHGISARYAFPFPHQVLDGALLALHQPRPHLPFWQQASLSLAASPQGLAWQLISLVRAHCQQGSTDFAPTTAYLQGAPAGPVTARELSLSTEVAQVLDRLLRQRPDLAEPWLLQGPGADTPAEHRWLAWLLHDLADPLTQHAHPALVELSLRRALAAGQRLAPLPGPVHLFGLSTLGGFQLDTLDLLGRCLDVHLYVLAPSDEWLAQLVGRSELAARYGAAPSPEARLEVMDEFRASHPLLADLGRPYKEAQLRLEHLPGGYLTGHEHFDSPESASVLGTLQAHVRHATALPEPHQRAPLPPHHDLSFHSCHGPLRQVETLRDRLLHLLASDPSLTPRDVVVMTPDVETYAPLVSAAFDQGGSLPRLPVSIADLGLRATNPVAEALLSLLELASERLDLPTLLQILSLHPVRQRFGLDTDDLEDLHRLLDLAGFRWGASAPDRAAADQPALHQNTLAFALERLALGVLFHDDGASVLQAPGMPEALDASPDMAPVDAMGTDSHRRLGALWSAASTLLHHREALGSAATAPTWRARLGALLDDCTATTEASSWLRTRVDEVLDELAAEVQAGQHTGPLSLQAVRAWLVGRFELSRSGDRPITGAITVCALEPMRSVPFRVVALLGMDNGAFPRGGRRRAWDPFLRRRPGELERRDIDRYLLLEALLSARDQVLVLYTGHDPHTGESTPPAVPIRELQDVVDRTWQGHGQRTASQLLTHTAPLQPWSAVLFQRDPRSPDATLCQAAQVLSQVQQGQLVPQVASIRTGDLALQAPDGAAIHTLGVPALDQGLRSPQKLLLRTRFRLWLEQDESEVAGREPLDLDGLERWQLRQQLVEQALVGQPQPEPLSRRWRAEGRLPIGPTGPEQVQSTSRVSQTLVQAAAQVLGPVHTWQQLDLAASLAVGDQPLSLGLSQAWVAPLGSQGRVLVHTSASSYGAPKLLRPWLGMLLAASQDPSIRGALAVFRHKAGPDRLRWLHAPADPTARLLSLLKVWQRAQTQVLPLFPTASAALVEVVGTEPWWGLDEVQRDKGLEAFTRAWEPGFYSSGDSGDPWVHALFAHTDPQQQLPLEPGPGVDSDPTWVSEAQGVWGPLLAALSDEAPAGGEA